MMHMNGIESLAETEFDEDMQQNHRIATTGKADAQALVAVCPGSEKSGDPAREVT
jgi:hypothetical protein